jgi:hypothetical protein
MQSVRNFNYESMVETLSQEREPGEEEWLARMYRFFLRATGNAQHAKGDFLAFLQQGQVPERVLLFARQCVESEEAATRKKETAVVSEEDCQVRAIDH